MKLDLIDHERRMHMAKDSYVVCDQCERTFSSMSNLNAHKEIHQRSAMPKHICNICNVAYFHRSALHRHQRNDHGHVRSQSGDSSDAKENTNSPASASPYLKHASRQKPLAIVTSPRYGLKLSDLAHASPVQSAPTP
ncbi:hypothetical protein HDU91_004152, partial [Kappamyces sp. JEL0680]